jgi:hypothetical protein
LYHEEYAADNFALCDYCDEYARNNNTIKKSDGETCNCCDDCLEDNTFICEASLDRYDTAEILDPTEKRYDDDGARIGVARENATPEQIAAAPGYRASADQIEMTI